MTVLIFLIVLAVLIFVHELGHFIFARLCGIRVDAFALGFGPKLFSWKSGETTYGVNLIPFGGYVKIFGENPDAESLTGPDSTRSFVNKSRWQQVIVLAAGVFFNFVFAALLYVGIFSTGVTATADGFQKYSSYFENQRIMITYVAPDSPADKAGIKAGDIVTGIKKHGERSNPVVILLNQENGTESIESIQNSISASKGEPITIQFIRNKEVTSVDVIPVSGLVEGKYAIGISMDNVVDVRLPFFISIKEGIHYTFNMIRDTAIGLYSFVAGIFKGSSHFSDISGPVGIAGIVGDAAGLGFTYLLMITALISINLGVINLIPFPALDGGRILFVLIESIIRRRISPTFSNVVNTLGFGLLMILMVVITYKDIANLVK